MQVPSKIQVGVDSCGSRHSSGLPDILALARTIRRGRSHMPRRTHTDTSAFLDELIDSSLPKRRGLGAWQALLRSHASLMRTLDVDLRERTGCTLGEFDVLAILARAGGQLRMTELSAHALASRSGLTRRVARLVDEGLVRRAEATDDGRGVVVVLTRSGTARVGETVPVHLEKVRELFADKLDDRELAVLERAMRKITVDCTFG